MADKFQLKAIISAVDKLTPTLTGIAKQAKIARKGLRDITAGVSKFGRAVGLGGAAVSAGIFGALKAIVDETSKFEKFSTVLSSIEGSSEAAKKAIDWVDKFANDTPYDLDEVVRAYTTLKGAGLDPTAGSLEAIGNAAAGADKTIEEAANAMRGAMVGNNESLKAFNITARKVGGQVGFMWSKNGKNMVSMAQANSREMIAATLSGIFNTMYPDAAKKLSKTWVGLWAMAQDYYTRFLRTIGQSGVFDVIKDKMSALLDRLDELVESGQFDKLAKQISADLVGVIERLSGWISSVNWEWFYNEVRETLGSIRDMISAVGGLKAVMLALAAAILAGPVLALGQIAIGIWTLGKALFGLAVANPVVAVIVLAIAALAGAAYLIYKNWGPIKEWFAKLWGGVKTVAAQTWDFLKEFFSWSPLGLILRSWGPVLRFFGGLFDKVRGIMTPPSGGASGMALAGAGAGGSAGSFGNLSGNRNRLSGEMTVRFENAPPGMRVSPGKTNQDVSFNPDVGVNPLSVFGM